MCVHFLLQREQQRSRSRSPIRSQTSEEGGYGDRRSHRSDNRDRRGGDRQVNNYRKNDYRGNDYHRNYRRRDNFSRDKDSGMDDNYNNRNHNGRPRSDRRQRSRYSGTRGDYGPVLARELDSTYEEKVNRNYANSIFVGNLTYNCTPEDLREFFSEIGEVVRADIITSKGHHRGMGTVEFTNSRDVDEAIRQFDGAIFMDRPIFVRQDNPPPDNGRDRHSNQRQQQTPRTQKDRLVYKVNIENLPYSINWQALKDMFKECGNVSRADIELDQNGYSKGLGTVVFNNMEDMQKAIDMYNGYDIEGNKLMVSHADIRRNTDTTVNSGIEASTKFTNGFMPKGERNNFIFCSNLPESTAKSDLYDLFETIGKINNAELRYNAEGTHTGIAVVEYNDIEDADICIDRLDKYNYGGCDLEISYAKKDNSYGE